VELPVTGVFEVKEGRIVFYRDYFDAQVLTSQLAG
jgi:limonene-1,2-epoxide hydrolase